jgi:hypothetical protein
MRASRVSRLPLCRGELMRRVVRKAILGSLLGFASCFANAQQQPVGDVYESGSGAGSPAQAVQKLYELAATMTDDPSSGYDAKTDHWPEADAAWQQWDNSMALNGNALTEQQRNGLIPCAAHLGAAIDSAERSYRIQKSQQNNAAAQADAQQLKATASKEFALCNLADALNGSNGTPATSTPIQGGVDTGPNGTPGLGTPGSGTPGTPGGPPLQTGISYNEPGTGTPASGSPGTTDGGGPGTPPASGTQPGSPSSPSSGPGSGPGSGSPPSSPAKQPSNPVANAADYLHGVIDGFGNCFKGMGSMLAGAGYFAQGDFQNAATAWGLEPGQSIVLKTMYSELTTPSVGSNVSPYQAGLTAGRRLCAYAVVPGVAKAAGTLIKGAAAPGSTFTNPLKGQALQDAIDGEVPPKPIEGEPPPKPIDPNAPQPQQIANKWVQTGNGPVQLGDYAGQGSFATVFKYGKSSVIKLSRSIPRIKGYGPESIEGQNIGAQRLQQAGVETPATSNYSAGGPDTPASIMAEDVTQKYPGSYQLSTSEFRTFDAAKQAEVLNAVTNVANQIAKSGDVLIDTNPGNFTIQNLSNAIDAIIHDPDMVMTVPEIQALPLDSIRRAVLNSALNVAGEPKFLDQPYTAQSLTDVLNIARERLLTDIDKSAIKNVPSGTVPRAQ